MDLVSILVVTLVTLLAISAGLYAYGVAHLEEIKKNWVTYRCNPVYMPLAGAVGSDILTNFTYCTMQSIHTYAGFVMDPVFQGMGEFQSILGSIMTSMQFIRQKMSTTVDGFLGIVSSIFGKLQNTLGVTAQLVGRIRTLVNRIISVFVVMLHIARTGVDSGMSVKNGPIGKTAEFLCFDPATPVILEDGRKLPMSEVPLDSILENGERVLSTLVFDGSETKMVEIQGIRVSGNHKILYHDEWIPCWEHPDALPIDSIPRLVCLTTRGHTIPVGDFTFKDYEETDDVEEFWAHVAEAHQSAVPYLRPFFRETGFHPTETNIRMEDGSIRRLSDVAIGDRVMRGGRVIGRVTHQISHPYARYGHSIFTAPGTIVFRHGRLDTIADSFYDSTAPLDRSFTCVNLLTEHAKVMAVDRDGSNVLFLDEQEIADTAVHEKRDKKVVGR